MYKFFAFKSNMGIGDWGLGIGDWGLGIGPNPQSPFNSNIFVQFSKNLNNLNKNSFIFKFYFHLNILV